MNRKEFMVTEQDLLVDIRVALDDMFRGVMLDGQNEIRIIFDNGQKFLLKITAENEEKTTD